MKLQSYRYLIFLMLFNISIYANICHKLIPISFNDLHIFIPINDKECNKNITRITYESIIPSLGPDGYHIFTALIDPNNNSNNSATNLITEERFTGENIPDDLELIIKAIDHNPIPNYSVSYDVNGFPLEINRICERLVGCDHTIYILKHLFVGYPYPDMNGNNR